MKSADFIKKLKASKVKSDAYTDLYRVTLPDEVTIDVHASSADDAKKQVPGILSSSFIYADKYQFSDIDTDKSEG